MILPTVPSNLFHYLPSRESFHQREEQNWKCAGMLSAEFYTQMYADTSVEVFPWFHGLRSAYDSVLFHLRDRIGKVQ